MMRKIKDGMISDKVSQRILWLTIVFFIAFFGITILSYYLLPEGFLLRKNRISDFKTSENFFLCTAQIFLYNILSVAFIFVGSMFSKRNEGEKAYRSYGRIGFLCSFCSMPLPWEPGHLPETQTAYPLRQGFCGPLTSYITQDCWRCTVSY